MYHISYNGSELKLTSQIPTYWNSGSVIIEGFEDRRNATTVFADLLAEWAPGPISLAEMREKYAEAVGEYTEEKLSGVTYHNFVYGRVKECFSVYQANTYMAAQVWRSVHMDGVLVCRQIARP